MNISTLCRLGNSENDREDELDEEDEISFAKLTSQERDYRELLFATAAATAAVVALSSSESVP